MKSSKNCIQKRRKKKASQAILLMMMMNRNYIPLKLFKHDRNLPEWRLVPIEIKYNTINIPLERNAASPTIAHAISVGTAFARLLYFHVYLKDYDAKPP